MPNKVVTFTNTDTGAVLRSFEITDAEVHLFITEIEAVRPTGVKVFTYQSQEVSVGGVTVPATGQSVIVSYAALDKNIIIDIV